MSYQDDLEREQAGLAKPASRLSGLGRAVRRSRGDDPYTDRNAGHPDQYTPAAERANGRAAGGMRDRVDRARGRGAPAATPPARPVQPPTSSPSYGGATGSGYDDLYGSGDSSASPSSFEPPSMGAYDDPYGSPGPSGWADVGRDPSAAGSMYPGSDGYGDLRDPYASGGSMAPVPGAYPTAPAVPGAPPARGQKKRKQRSGSPVRGSVFDRVRESAARARRVWKDAYREAQRKQIEKSRRK